VRLDLSLLEHEDAEADALVPRRFNAVVRSPMRFFETTPIGTILNRFSRDIYVIDEVLARTFGGFARTLAGVVGMIAVISSSAPAFLLILVPILFVYKRIQTCVSSLLSSSSRASRRFDAEPLLQLLPRHLARAQAARCHDQEPDLRLVPGDALGRVDDPCLPPERALHGRERGVRRPQPERSLPLAQLQQVARRSSRGACSSLCDRGVLRRR